MWSEQSSSFVCAVSQARPFKHHPRTGFLEKLHLGLSHGLEHRTLAQGYTKRGRWQSPMGGQQGVVLIAENFKTTVKPEKLG